MCCLVHAKSLWLAHVAGSLTNFLLVQQLGSLLSCPGSFVGPLVLLSLVATSTGGALSLA